MPRPGPVEAQDVRGLDDGELARRISAAEGTFARAEEEELLRRFARRLVSFGRRRLGSEDDARDLAQDVLVLGLEKLRAGEVRHPERIGSFLLGVARTLVLSGRRRRDPHEALDGVSEMVLAVAAEHRDPLATSRVTDCLERLPERERTVVVLSFYAEQSSTEVAASLGLSRSNVRVIRHRSVARLRECVEHRGSRAAEAGRAG